MEDVNAYLATVQPNHRKVLEHIRQLVKSRVPEAEESISYAIPAFKLNGKPLLYYAGFKDHMSIFPTPGPANAVQDKLQGHIVHKGTIQFTLEKPLSDELILEILEARLNEIG